MKIHSQCKITAPKVLAGAVLLSALHFSLQPANAQFGGARNQAQRNTNNNNPNNGGVLPLPEGVDDLVSIDAHNVLLAQTSDPETGGNQQVIPLTTRYVYSGGIAKIFGGTSIPTEIFVSPAFNDSNIGGNNGIGGNRNNRNRNNRRERNNRNERGRNWRSNSGVIGAR